MVEGTAGHHEWLAVLLLNHPCARQGVLAEACTVSIDDATRDEVAAGRLVKRDGGRTVDVSVRRSRCTTCEAVKEILGGCCSVEGENARGQTRRRLDAELGSAYTPERVGAERAGATGLHPEARVPLVTGSAAGSHGGVGS